MALMRSVLSASASLRSKLTLEKRQFLAGWVERVECAEGLVWKIERTELYREVEAGT